MAVCAHCGQENPAGFSFCGACGAALDEASPPRETRKTVTLLFCDVTGSTALGERLDPEALRRVMRRYFDEISAVVERHGGTVEKFVGDAAMAVFGIPQVREDDALRAVRAAEDIRRSLPAVATELGVELVFRTGVNTGEVMVGDGQTLATGDAVNIAARLEQAAAPGEILIGDQTYRLVRDAVVVEPVEPLTVKGKSQPLPARRLLSVVSGAAGVKRRSDSAMVGRERELRLLQESSARAVAERRCYLFTLLGSAGVGKSRLVREFLAGAAADATVVRGRCLPYGEGITFFPLVEVLMQLGEPAQAVLGRVSQGGSTSAVELFFEVRKLFEAIAAERPLIVVLDDLHWAEPTLLDLLDHIADLSRQAPLMLLCIARPELLEERPSWAGGKLNATTALLEPLAAEASQELVERLAAGLEPAARARVVEAAEGNPLFLEEMVALVEESGRLDVPPTIQALLAARLERLADPERSLVERGAVEGKVFHRGAVREMSPELLKAGIDIQLAALVRKELISPEDALFEGDEAYRFRHLLIRDAAYDALPKSQRAQLHAAFAAWLERHGRELVEFDEIAGWHLEQALACRRELGLPAEPAETDRAARHLLSAGERAMSRSDVSAADNLLTRALAILPDGHPGRPEVALALAEACLHHAQYTETERLLDLADSRPELHAKVAVLRTEVLLHARPDQLAAYVQDELPPALAEFERLGDERWLARAYLARFQRYQLANVFGPACDEALIAAHHARRAGDRALLSQACIAASHALLWGPADAATQQRVLAELDAEDTGLDYQPYAVMARAMLAHRAGLFDQARALFDQANDLLEGLGARGVTWAMAMMRGPMEVAAGNSAAGVAVLERARDELGKLGEVAYRSTVTACLAEALYADGQYEAAEQMALQAEQESAALDSINFAVARAVRARLAAQRGAHDSADELSKSALEYANRMDMPSVHGDALVARAYVLRARGRQDEATQALEQALELYEQKGDLASAARVRSDHPTLQG
jgi:class 3 adenylate cyclase/tetratricopeptide (TPR) repeat protein